MDNYDDEHDDDFIDDDLPPLVESTSSSYIPRPPNAFILFRSAFIRSQRISGRVEGNHSTLSKIIGMYWRALTNEEKQEWEDKAKVALEEHRRRYPDWRFRPGVNGGRGRGRGGRGRRGRGRGGEGDGRGRVKREREDGRLGKIRDLLVEGREGEDLERAVNEWERERDRAGKRSRSVPSEKRAGKPLHHARAQSSSTPYKALDFPVPGPSIPPPQADLIPTRQGSYSFIPDPSPYSPTEDTQSPWHTSPYQSSYTNPGSAHISSFSTLSGWAGDSDMQSPTTSTFGPSNVEPPREYTEIQTYDNFADASYNLWHEERHYSFDSNELHNPFSFSTEFNQYHIPGPSSPGPPSSIPSPSSPFQVGASSFSDLRFIDEGFRFPSSPPQEVEGEIVPFQPVQVIDQKGKGKAHEEDGEVAEGYVNWN
ncbi:uncharacterized protein BT62DRAFT_916534 [Guyanagaster necrorhizus]|uniref:HMG box domain-containing protein n=1 Tax=Guyanagaster necrorhizus TaxID=856835 RepID=A0A9P7W3M3_9AGAR|nr:uncharacterized protein BT62DRAFT_916534 [Guyanagaster necrorhizus MCA 3950]KAG7451557.1 hypothetical protein BT62DRAFT_916534 [Guyanagaster necrorhizus MCA 3950]